ncbi:hypothetical protein KKE99_00805 [Patescibacteria group bacterium]|nr:hypothetical protein [Patescibacteria group bacterium]
MVENKLTSEKKVLILIIVLFAIIASLSVVSYLSSVKKTSPIVVQTPTTNNIITEWITYSNSDIGVEFKYPSTLGTPEVFQTDNTNKKPEDVFAGKKIDVFFKDFNNNYSWLLFVAYTSDYKSFKDLFAFGGNNNISNECLKPLSYSGTGESCKIIGVANDRVIWKNYFNEDECSPIFGSQVYFNNKSQSIYKGLSFMFHIKDAEAKVVDLYSCVDDKATEQAYLEAAVQSKNIMEKKNLSEGDLEQINLIEQMLSTFKFIE